MSFGCDNLPLDAAAWLPCWVLVARLTPKASWTRQNATGGHGTPCKVI